MELSKRLMSVASMVTPGSKVADIGCDHGYVAIYLLQQKMALSVIAMDVNEGPLQRAREHIQREGLTDYIDVRLSDGANALSKGEADTAVIAGMGGKLMVRILSEAFSRLGRLEELVLQPQSEIFKVRQFLWQSGYLIVAEDMVLEDGKYYQIIKAKPVTDEAEAQKKQGIVQCSETAKEAYSLYGPCLLKGAHEVCISYLYREKENYSQIKTHILRKECSEGAKIRVEEIDEKLKILETALEIGGKLNGNCNN